MGILILLRHGQSKWNKKNIFTGWVDVPLSPEGIKEAQKAGRAIKAIPFDVIFVSTLMRASLTAMIAMSEHDEGKVPVMMHEGKLGEWGKIYSEESKKDIIPTYASWHLNERYYGELQGRDKDQCRAEFGADQVKIWRRSFDTPPPGGESLKMTAARTLPFLSRKDCALPRKGEKCFNICTR